MLRVIILSICVSFSHSASLYGTYLVRMKFVSSPRAAGGSVGEELRLLKSQGLESLKTLEKVLDIEQKSQPTQTLGPRIVGSPKVKSFEKFWFIHSARLVMRVDAAEELSRLPAVAEVIPDEKLFLFTESKDSINYDSELQNLGIADLHKLDLKGDGIRIGLIDTGISKHPEFMDKVLAYKDFSRESSPHWNDPLGHGTHVAGLLVGGSDSGYQIGIVPEAELIVAKVIEPVSANGSQTQVEQRIETFASRVLSAMQWMLDPDGNPETIDYPQIINNSWGFPTAAPRSRNFFEHAIARWREVGIIPLFAAGNEGADGLNTIAYPANSTQVITIGATRRAERAPFSSMGSDQLRKPDFMAPGYRLYSLKQSLSGVVYGRLSGTSMAVPLVSGLIAMMKQIDPFLEYAEIYKILHNNIIDLDRPGWDAATGWGQIVFPNTITETRSYFDERTEHGGKDTFKYFKFFKDKYDTTGRIHYREQLIKLELAYMSFLERCSESSKDIVFERWIAALNEEVAKSPEVFSALFERVNKRLKFLQIMVNSE